MWVDLHHLCGQVEGDDAVLRVGRLAALLPSTALFAVGGFPFRDLGGEELFWCDGFANEGRIRQHIRQALGTSAILTYTNRNRKTLDELATICSTKEHTWGYRWITLSFVFAGHPAHVELAFARSTHFFMSWPEAVRGGLVFAASGSLHDWINFVRHANDKGFDPDTRKALGEVSCLLSPLLGTP